MPFLKDFFGLAKRSIRYRNRETALLIQRNLRYIRAPLRPEGDRIRCDTFNLTLDPARHEFFLEGMPFVKDLAEANAGHFEPTPEGEMEFRTGPIRIIPETLQELFILDEVFRTGVYDVDCAGEWLVCDIGANVGITAAFFAGIKGWETVGYEPFPDPFSVATQNIERSDLGGKVTLKQQGVADRDQTLRLTYNRGSRGSNGLFGNNALDKSGEDIEVEVSFVDAATVVTELVQRANGRPLLAKIDCEGAEYAIVRRLREANLLTAFSVILMEFHLLAPEHSYEALVRDLTESGFVLRGDRHTTTHVGMIWAVLPGATRP